MKFLYGHPQGKVRRIGFRPLYKSVPDIAEKEENKELYSMLSLVDMLREGRARERTPAADLISKKLEAASNDV